MDWIINRMTTLIAIIIFFIAAPSYACGIHYNGEEYRVALFDPYIIGDDYSAFFYSADRMNNTKSAAFGSDRRRNCEAWAEAIGDGVTFTDVYLFLYPVTLDEVLAVRDGLQSSFKDNAFVKALQQPKNKDILDYVVWAKSYEVISSSWQKDPWSEYNYWHELQGDANTISFDKLYVDAESAYQTIKSDFLRHRYAYQLLVIAHYAGDKQKVIDLYEEHFANTYNDVLADWAFFYRAAFISDVVEQSYAYALLFTRTPSKAFPAYQSFDKKILSQILLMCQNDQERASVLLLNEIKNPGRSLSGIKTVYQAYPQHPLLKLLLVREINKLEDWLLTPELSGNAPSVRLGGDSAIYRWQKEWNTYNQKNRKKDQAYLVQVRAFAQMVLKEKKSTTTPQELKLMVGHLYAMEQNIAGAHKMLVTIGPLLDEAAHTQLLSENILHLIQSQDILSSSIQQQLGNILYKLTELLPKRPNGDRDLNALHLLLAKTYEQAGSITLAYLFHNLAWDFPTINDWNYQSAYYSLIRYLDWRAKPSDIDAVLSLINKVSPSRLEQYALAAPLPSTNALFDLRGTIALRENDLEEAYSSFAQVDSSFWETSYQFAKYLKSDPFMIPPVITTNDSFPTTKTAYIEQLQQLEIVASKNDAKALLKLGTAWLNSTNYGHSWMLYSYGKTRNMYNPWSGHENFQTRSNQHVRNYYYCDRAHNYLQRALAVSNDPEIKASATFLLAKCEGFRLLTTAFLEEEFVDDGKFQGSHQKQQSYLIDFSKTYANTQSYQRVITACPNMRTYWGK